MEFIEYELRVAQHFNERLQLMENPAHLRYCLSLQCTSVGSLRRSAQRSIYHRVLQWGAALLMRLKFKNDAKLKIKALVGTGIGPRQGNMAVPV